MSPDADAQEVRPGEDLQSLRQALSQEAIRGAAGGQESIPQSGALRSDLREQSSGGREVRAAPTGQEVSSPVLPDMRDEGRVARSPQGSQPREQRADQPDDSLRLMSSEASLAGGQGQACGCDSFNWGQYQKAIHSWEGVIGRAAPLPVDEKKRLEPAFVEFLMGFPQGWTDGITRRQALRALGNAVVPQQGAAAFRLLFDLEECV